MAEVKTEATAGAAGIGEDQLGSLLQKEFKPKTDRARSEVETAVRTLAEQALRDTAVVSDDVIGTIKAIIAEIDRKLTDQVNLILHNERFQQVEGSWRGLSYLINNTETDEMLKIRVLNIGKKDLGKTLKKYKGVAWDQSPLFKKLYEEEYGQLGGEPYGCLVGDYQFDHTPPDVELLGQIAQIAAASHAPFIAAAAPALMGMDSWQQLANPRDLAKIFGAPDYAAWRSLRESDDAKYVGLAMPRFLARLPYGAKTSPVDEFDFEEETGTGEHSRYTWANAAYAMAVNINRSFKLYGWCSQIRGVESGGAVEGLPVHTFPSDDGGVDMKCPTEIAISDRREAELANCGLMPLIHRKNTGRGRLHRRAINSEAQRVHRSGRNFECAALGAPTVPVCQLPFRALPEMHGSRQGGHLQGTRGYGTLPVGLDQGLRARQSAGCGRHAKGAEATGRRRSEGRRGRGQPGLLQRQVLPPAPLSARRRERYVEPRVASAVAEDGLRRTVRITRNHHQSDWGVCSYGFRYILMLDGIKGESSDDKHKGEIDIEAISWAWPSLAPEIGERDRGPAR